VVKPNQSNGVAAWSASASSGERESEEKEIRCHSLTSRLKKKEKRRGVVLSSTAALQVGQAR
jgi:hypothetical protein